MSVAVQMLSAYVSGWLVVFPYIGFVLGVDVFPCIYRCYWFRGGQGPLSRQGREPQERRLLAFTLKNLAATLL